MGLLDAMDDAILEVEGELRRERTPEKVAPPPPPPAASAAPSPATSPSPAKSSPARSSPAGPAKVSGSMMGAESSDDDDDGSDDGDDSEEVEYDGPTPEKEAVVWRKVGEKVDAFGEAAAPSPEKTAVIRSPPKDDVFGVAYKPYKVFEETAPAPRFEGEKELERDLAQSEFADGGAGLARGAATADDDEFGGDDDEWEAAAPDAAALAAARARLLAEETAEAERIERELNEAATAARVGAAAKALEAEAAAPAAEPTYGLGASAAALEATTRAYAPPTATAAGASIRGSLAIGGGIEEGDEDAEDAEDAPPVIGQPSPERGNGATDEWAGFESHALGTGPARGVAAAADADAAEICDYDAALAYFRAVDMSGDADKIVPTEFKRRSLIGKLTSSAPRLTFENAEKERDFAFLVAQRNYEPEIPILRALLKAIFKGLLPREKRPCSIIGGHWELIGFQGSDPRTDVNRSMRCLALLQMLHLIESEPKLARTLFEYARRDNKDWPFACTSIGFTRSALASLRNGELYKKCNKDKAILPALHERHAALFRDFLSRLENGEDRFQALNDIRLGKKAKAGASKPAPKKKAAFVSRGAKAAAAHPKEGGAFASIAGLPEDAADASCAPLDGAAAAYATRTV